MFVLYDKNMNKINFPEGVTPLDIFISSIDKERVTERLEGKHGSIDYGFTYNSRNVELNILLKSNDTKDYRLLRDTVYALFQTNDEMYVSETYQPGKRYLISINDQFVPERVPNNRIYAEATITCTKQGLPFAESIGTTSDIDPPELIPLMPELWEIGSYWTADGYPNNAEGRVRLKNKYDITPSTLYKIEDSSTELFTMYVYLYKENGTYSRAVKLENGENSTRNFTTQSDEAKFTIAMWDENYTFVTDIIGRKINVSLKKASAGGINSDNELWGFGMGLIADDDSLIYTHTDTSFKIFNAGNVTIHPFEQQLKVTISNVIGSTSYLQLRNATNGSMFRITEGVASDKIIVMDGANITNNGLSYLRNTNKQFIELSPGWNNFQLTGVTSAEVSFDFPFYYL